MQSPRVLIVSPKEKDSVRLRTLLEKEDRLPEMDYAHFPTISSYLSAWQWPNLGPNIVAVDYRGMPTEKFMAQHAMLRARHPHARFFMLGGERGPGPNLINRVGNARWFKLSGSERLGEKIRDEIYSLTQQGEIFTPVNLAIYGIGTFTKGLLALIREKPWIGQVHVYSQTAKKDSDPKCTAFSYDSLVKALDLSPLINQQRLLLHRTLDDWVEGALRSDIVSVATGPRLQPDEDFARGSDDQAKKHEEFFRRENLPRIQHLAEVFPGRSYKGQVLITSNPPELCAKAFVKYSKIDPSQVSCPTSDSPRLAQILFEHIQTVRPNTASAMARYYGNDPRDGIATPILGTHFHPIPVLGRSKVSYKIYEFQGPSDAVMIDELSPLSKYLQITPHLEFKIERDLQEAGVLVMRGAKNGETGYSGSPGDLMDTMERMAHYQPLSPSAVLSAWHEKCGMHALTPATWNIRNSRFEINEEQGLEAPLRIKQRVKARMDEERKAARRYDLF